LPGRPEYLDWRRRPPSIAEAGKQGAGGDEGEQHPVSIAIALAQANPTACDIAGNLAILRRLRAEAAAQAADLVVFPARFLAGCPPVARLSDPTLIEAARQAVERLAAETADGGPAILLGAPWQGPDGRLHDAALLLHGGAIAGKALRHAPAGPDEPRPFAPGPIPGPLRLPLRGGDAVRLGVMLGADMAAEDVAEGLGECGAEILVVLDASPFARDAADRRQLHAVARVTETGLPLLYVNQVGGQDGIAFDGGSFALAADRRLALQAPWFEEALALVRWRRGPDEAWSPEGRHAIARPVPEPEASWRAMVVALRDRVGKSGLGGAVLELSGGIASALTAAIAVDALGPAHVRAVALSGQAGAGLLAAGLGIRLDTVDMAPAVEVVQRLLTPLLGEEAMADVRQDLRSRLADVALGTVADGLGLLVLAADTAGTGHVVLREADAAALRALARWRNTAQPRGCLGPTGAVIPEHLVAGLPP
jgi:NAD+ synthase